MGAVVGSTVPRVFTPPLRELTSETSWGPDIIWFAREVLQEPLTAWQEWFVTHAFELLPPEKVKAMYPDQPQVWDRDIPRFKNIVILIARQNGKTHVAKVVIKWALFRKRLPRIMGAAQTKNDAKDLWEEILEECEANPGLKKRMRRTTLNNGSETMRSRWGTYKIASLERGSARGKTNNMLFMDELREHVSWAGYSALSSTTLSPVGAFNLLASNAGDYRSVVLKSIREKSIAAIESGTTDDVQVGLFEWSADPTRHIDDREGWAEANPDLGQGRMTERDIQAERESKTDDEFRTENLCQWVDDLDDIEPIFGVSAWSAVADHSPHVTGDSVLAVDLSWDAKRVASVAAVQCNGKYHLSLSPLLEFDREETVGSLVKAVEVNSPLAVALETTGERSTLVHPLEQAGIVPEKMSRVDAAAASVLLMRLFLEGKLTHDGNPRWVEALSVAAVKESATGSKRIVNSPEFVAASFAVWTLQEFSEPEDVSVVQKKKFVGKARPVKRANHAAALQF